jgi:DNA-binding NtrC family response regulator
MANKPTILVIDDEIGQPGSPRQVGFLRTIGATDRTGAAVADYPYSFEFCSGGTPKKAYSVEAILDYIRRGWDKENDRFWAMILLDVNFGNQATFGYEVLDALRTSPEFGADIPVVMLTREGGTRRTAAHGGADGFLPKVTDDGRPALTPAALDAAILREGLLPDMRRLPDENQRLVGNSLAFVKTLRDIRRTIRNGTIRQMCFLGEPGVGKTELVKYTRDITCGPAAPYQKTVADAGNPHLQLGAIFGCWPGAYNDAPRDGAPGLFELTHGGVFFLDEVANLSPEAQQRLLEVQAAENSITRQISRYGIAPLANEDVLARCLPNIRGRFNNVTGLISVDVTLITATNTRLDDPAVREACGFRPDLWGRLTPHIVVPNLNERRSDISLLFQQMLRSRLGLRTVDVHEDALTALADVDWSANDNIRGLGLAADQAALRYNDLQTVTVKQLPTELLRERRKPRQPATVVPEASSSHPVSASLPQESTGFAAILVRRYREDLELLCEALLKTRDPAKPDGENMIPARALRQLLGVPVTGADIDRLINKLFIAPVFKLPKTLEKSLLKHGLRELQQWARDNPLLSAYVDREPRSDEAASNDDAGETIGAAP